MSLGTRLLGLAVLCSVAFTTISADAESRREIRFPDIPGYKTVIADLHTHTVFSDGSVWPTVRIHEAWREGIEALALTDHIEYKPHEDYVSTDHNASYKVSVPTAQQKNVMLIKGTEITRDTPPGHFNAIFIKDADPIDTPDFLDAVGEAIEQGGFLFWNHPGWKGPIKGQWQEVHDTLHERGWLGGIEVLNASRYYPEAHKWCMDKGLAILGNSDIHPPSLYKQIETGDHRTLTLVFAEEDTQDGLRDALRNARTAAWGNNRLIGREEQLRPLFEAAVTVHRAHFRDPKNLWVDIDNESQMDFELELVGEGGPKTITLVAGSRTQVRFERFVGSKKKDIEYQVKNILIGPDTSLPVTLSIQR